MTKRSYKPFVSIRLVRRNGLLDKIIYVADYIEPGRSFPGVKEARELAMIDLDAAVAYRNRNNIALFD